MRSWFICREMILCIVRSMIKYGGTCTSDTSMPNILMMLLILTNSHYLISIITRLDQWTCNFLFISKFNIGFKSLFCGKNWKMSYK